MVGMRSGAFLALLSTCAVSFAEGSTTRSLACPISIESREALTTTLPNGWSAAIESGPRVLEKVAFFEGPPPNHKSIAPTRDATPVQGTRQRVAIWLFATSAAPVWLACHYTASRVVLMQALPTSVRACTVTYGASATATAITCR